jgi:cytochrome c-type biogenesis protein CcmH/NrfF
MSVPGAREAGRSSRREFFSLAVGAIALSFQGPDSLPGSGPSGRLWDPSRAGRPLEPVTAADNDQAIQAIEKHLRCTCGCNQDVYTCRTTDFTCETSPAMHRRVVALAQSGQTAQQILDTFVRENGVAILMAPPKRGFNLAAWVVPPVAVVVAGLLLTRALRRWSRGGTPPATPPAAAAASAAELEWLEHELERFTD